MAPAMTTMATLLTGIDPAPLFGLGGPPGKPHLYLP
jgi:hypothetical protein